MLILWGSPIVRGGVTKKTIIYGELPKKGIWTICRGLGKKQGGGCFDAGLILKIGLVDVSALNFDQSFLQFNAKKKINAKKSSRFEFKC